MSQLARNFVRLGKDGMELTRAFVKNRGNLRPVLLDQARASNSVANSMLQVDKEMGLIRYHGFTEYFKKRMQSTLPSITKTTMSDSKYSSGEPEATPRTAKIAFMVTASMKQELSESLGYEQEQVKKLTPLQASLILDQRIMAADMEEELPKAETEYEAQRQKEEEAQRLQAEQDAQDFIQQQQQQTSEPNSQPLSSTTTASTDSSFTPPESTTEIFAGHGFMSRNVLDTAATTFGDDMDWFEVVETNPQGKTSRVGLYNHQDEATLGLQTRQDIAQAKQTGCTFELRPITPEELAKTPSD